MKVPDRTHRWQTIFLVLLFICVAQVSYWVVEQVGQATLHRDSQLARISSLSTLELAMDGNRADVPEAVGRFLEASANDAAAIDSAGDDPVLAIHDEYESSRSRLLWEGTFFVIVLLGTMGVISRTLRESRLLVERQHNFIASVTHELRTPLASLKLSADTLGMRAPDEERSKRLAARMSEDVARLNDMVSQILQSARLDAKAPNAEPSATPLFPLLQAEVQRMHTLLEPRGVNFHLDAAEDLHVFARPSELKTVLTNLLSNAGKSCRAAGGGDVRVAAAIEGERVKVSITDDGLGFDPAESDKLFQRFYRPGDELRRETSGYGLGLFLVQELTRNHGGDVRATSGGPGQGAQLTLWWPAAPAPVLS